MPVEEWERSASDLPPRRVRARRGNVVARLSLQFAEAVREDIQAAIEDVRRSQQESKPEKAEAPPIAKPKRLIEP